MKLITCSLAVLIVLGVELTTNNFDEKTTGKTVFIKLFSPYCIECREMEPAWNRLMKKYERSTTTLIAEVNCHEADEDLCNKLVIDHKYPKLMYGDPKSLSHYKGAYDYQTLLTFAEKNVGPICGPENLDLCDADQKAKIKRMQEQGLDELRHKLYEFEHLMHTTESKFYDKMDQMNKEREKKYFKLIKDNDKTIEDIREKHEFDLMEAVHKHLQNRHDDDHMNHMDF